MDEHGDLDAAGFVQVMQGSTSDPARARELTDNDDPAWRDYRPDVLGSLMAVHGEDAWTMVIYFTSEADARAGEQKEPPESIRGDGRARRARGRRDDVRRPAGALAGRPVLIPAAPSLCSGA